MTRQQTRRRRRGAQAVEMALITLPLFATLFTIMDYGWYFGMRHAVSRVAMQAARVGSQVPQDGDPIGTAQTEATNYWSSFGFGGTFSASASLVGLDPQFLVVDVRLETYELVGLMPTPDKVHIVHARRMEDQPDPP